MRDNPKTNDISESLGDAEKFRILVESVKDYAIFLLDPQGRVASWNEGARRIKGYEAGEIIGQHFSKFYTPEEADWKPPMELKEAALKGRFEDEGWRLRKDGTRFWANVVITALRDAKGELFGFAKITRDLTERRRLEAALADRARELGESRSFLDQVIENIPDIVVVKGARDLRIVRVNRAAEEFLGLPSSEIVGKSDYDLFSKEKADEIVASSREALRKNAIVEQHEEILQSKHHGERVLHTRRLPILDESARPLYVLTVAEDVTEVRKARQERIRLIREQADAGSREREMRRAAFLSEASSALGASLDYHATLAELSRLVVPAFADWCTITVIGDDGGKQRVGAVHRDPAKAGLISELSNYYPVRADQEGGIGHVIKTGKSQFTPVVQDEALVAAARDARHLEIMRELGCHSCILVPIIARKRVLGAISLVTSEPGRNFDLADLACAEELGRRAGIAIDNATLYDNAQKAIRARDEFLSVASHELKTPLTSLKLQVQMRKRNFERGNLSGFSSERLPKLIADDERQVDRLARLVEDMLDISRLNAGKLHLQPEKIDIRALTQEVAERFSAQLEASGSSISLEIGGRLEGWWDRNRLEQVITNLITNAIKYGGKRPIDIGFSADDESVQVRVRDRGIGIAEADRERIFGQFERAVSGASAGGLGLGLYIARQIVEAHNGTIRVESQLGSGSTFIVELPRRSAEAPKVRTKVTGGGVEAG